MHQNRDQEGEGYSELNIDINGDHEGDGLNFDEREVEAIENLENNHQYDSDGNCSHITTSEDNNCDHGRRRRSTKLYHDP